MKWIKAPKLPDELLRSYYCKIYNNVFKKEFKKQVLITLDGTWQTGDFDTVIEWLDESETQEENKSLPIDIRSISQKWVGIWQRGENPNLFQCVDEAIKEALKVEPSIDEITRLQNIGIEMANDIEQKRKEIESLKQQLNKVCHCTPDQTTGHTAGICNVCGKDVEEAAIQHADSLHKKGSSELAGNGKLTENDCWENAYFNFKEGSKQLNK